MTDSQTVPGDPTWTDLLVPSREVPLCGLRGIQVNRTLPHRAPPTVGAWCFVDCFGPTGRPMLVLPHPHTGLQAVTLPLRGHIRHKDSPGNDVVLKPGEVNLMTAGDGVAHSEFSLGEGPLHGVQLWVALPDERRTGAADFEHHVDLPVVGSPNLTTMMFMGELAAVTSPVTTYTPLVGADLELCAGKATLGLNRNFEHAIMVLEGQAKVNSLRLPAAQMLYLRPGREWINLSAEADTRLLLLGGEPFAEELVMWWNFIGRTHEEIVAAREDWEAGSERFGRVDDHDDQPIPAPPMPQVRIKPRRRRHDAIVS